MEIIPYILDVILFAFALYWSAANAATKPGTPVFGLFRYRVAAGRALGAGADPKGDRRRFRPLAPAAGPPAPRPDASRPNVARPNARLPNAPTTGWDSSSANPGGQRPNRQLPRR